jgi:sialic acid synthase SpsE
MHRKTSKTMIISELSPQNEGDIDFLKTMMLQSKIAGADAVKVQLYDSIDLLGSDKKKYCEITYKELEVLKKYADNISIELFASVFDFQRLLWVQKLDLPYQKIASKVHKNNPILCNKIIDTGKVTFISNGLNQNDFEYSNNDNIVYFYCVANYPTCIEDITMPDFRRHKYYQGFSDHTFGLTAAKTAIVRGAKFIEKHFTLSRGMQSSTNKAHYGSMTMQDLIELRSFANDFARMKID